MTIKWVGTVGLVGLFALVVVLPTALVCGASVQLAAMFAVGILVSYLLFAATQQHEIPRSAPEDCQHTSPLADSASRRHGEANRTKAVAYAWLAVAAWVPYLILLLSMGWTGWWWGLAIAFALISVVIVFDLAGTVILNA